MIRQLSSYQRCVKRISENWLPFQEKRHERMRQQERHGHAAEKVAENILEDLFTQVLDWSLTDVNNQIDYADLLLTRLGIKHLIVEVKRPNALSWNLLAVEAALEQARRYADEQKVRCVAVSDGVMLYAADIVNGGLQDRVFVSLEAREPSESLFWISTQGIYRPREDWETSRRLLPATGLAEVGPLTEAALLHPKYKIPAMCFAYVGDASKPHTWKLPYLLADGTPDIKRLPKAIQSILSNYRGATVSGIAEQAIPDVLLRLARAAAKLRRLPHQCGETAPIYVQLTEALEQSGHLDEVLSL
jgi:hypothetical protein